MASARTAARSRPAPSYSVATQGTSTARRSAPPPRRARPRPLLAATCYVPVLGWAAALSYLVLPAYRDQAFLRFHALQSLVLPVLILALLFALAAVGSLAGGVSGMVPLLLLPVFAIVAIGAIILWAVLAIKALQGECLAPPLLAGWLRRRAPGA